MLGVRAQIEAHRTTFPVWKEVVDEIIEDEDRVVTRFTSCGTNLGEFQGNTATGNRVEIPEACIYHLADGKIVEM